MRAIEFKKNLLQVAFRKTIPVMIGYLFLGFAAGLLLVSKGVPPIWGLVMSAFVYSGSMHFLAAELLTSVFQPVYVFILTILVNARHIFYGVSMLEKFSDTKPFKPYLIFGLTDETFSLHCTTNQQDPEMKKWLMFFMTLLDQIYWIIGTTLGMVVGSLLKFNSDGIEFVMTALFVVIVVNQWKTQSQHAPALTGFFATIVCLIIFGPTNFLVPTMVVIVAVLCAIRARIERSLP